MISIIVAMAHNGLIGINNKLPWNEPGDLKQFAKLTKDKTLLMGHLTYISLPASFFKSGNRNLIVLTRDPELAPSAVSVNNGNNTIEYTDNIYSVIQDFTEGDNKDRELMVCGGRQVYEVLLGGGGLSCYADKMYITHIPRIYYLAGNKPTYFPPIDWRLLAPVNSESINATGGTSPLLLVTYKKVFDYVS